MKKLMTTMLAVAVGISLRAADNNDKGTSFEGLGTGTYDITATLGELKAQEAGQTYWVTNGTETLEIADADPYTDPDNRPTQYIEVTNTKYLKVKTTLGSPVQRNVSVGGAATEVGDGGFYFDSLVKFTAFEGDQTVDLNGGKLAIWLKENLGANDEPESTNLVITAGYFDGASTVATNYNCSVANINFNDGGWHRVTVKAIKSIYKTGTIPGFVVFIDGVYVQANEYVTGINSGNLTDSAEVFYNESALFPSAIQDGTAEIAAVAFDGQGEVDDLVFTETAPAFAKDSEFFTIDFDTNFVKKVKYNVDSGEYITITAPAKVPYEANMLVGVAFEDDSFETGYMLDEVEPGTGVTDQGGNAFSPTAAEQKITVKAKVAGAAVNGVPYETATAAFAAITAGTAGAGPFTVALNTAATSGVELDNASVSVILDLAGNSITAGSGDAAAITLVSGTLLVTNSTETVGQVNGYNGGNAVVTAGGALTIADGIYNGAVDVSSATSLITGGSFSVNDNKDPDSGTLPPAPNADLAAAALAAGNELIVGSGSSYYTVQVKTAATVNVTVTGGANATAVWTVNSETVSAPSTLTEGDTYSVVYTANTGYEFLLGAITSASGTAGTSDIAITISDATAIEYTITLDAGDGASVDPATTNYTVESGAITLPTPTTSLIGVTFGGWTNETITTAITAYTPAVGDESFTLYAKWDAVAPCTITLVSGDNSTVDPSSINFWAGQSAITLPTPVLNQGITGVTFGGWTNETITTAITEYTPPAENAESFTLYAKWDAVAPTYPSYIDTSDSTIKNQYDAWAQTYNVSAGANDYETAFLLNVDPNTLGAKLDTTDFSISGTTVTININRGNLNGYPYVKKAATLEGLASATAEAVTVVPADNIENGGRVTLTGESGTTQFYQIGVQVAPVAVPNAD